MARETKEDEAAQVSQSDAPTFKVNARNLEMRPEYKNVECFWELLHDEDVENYLLVARRSTKPRD
jgi:hypothetical protein